MLLLLTLLTTTTLVLSSSSEDDRIIDLQELLLNVSNSYQDFGQGMKELGQNADRNVVSISENIQLVIQSANESAQRADEHAQRAEDIAKANAQRADENAQRANGRAKKANGILENNTEVLERILLSLSALIIHTENQNQAKNCAELYIRGERSSGTYAIRVRGINGITSFPVYCDMATDGGGWTVFQRRGDFGFPQDYFYKNWTEYKNGFGELTKEFWLGNDRISSLSQQASQQMRIDLRDMEGERRYIKYSKFGVKSESSLYKLDIDGHTGNAGDSLSYSNQKAFSTKDQDNDDPKQNSAVMCQGGWWYRDCANCNLNGLNLRGPSSNRGIFWYHWKNTDFYSMAFTEMKMRPANF